MKIGKIDKQTKENYIMNKLIYMLMFIAMFTVMLTVWMSMLVIKRDNMGPVWVISSLQEINMGKVELQANK